jgi:transposase
VRKSLVKVRPVYHQCDRRAETHIFICFLAYLVAKTVELRAAGLPHRLVASKPARAVRAHRPA